LFEDFYGFLFGDSVSVGDFLGESAAIAVFDDHNFQPLVLVDIIQFHDVIGVNSHHKFGLCFGEPLADLLDLGAAFLPVDGDEIKNFYSYLLFSLVIHASVD